MDAIDYFLDIANLWRSSVVCSDHSELGFGNGLCIGQQKVRTEVSPPIVLSKSYLCWQSWIYHWAPWQRQKRWFFSFLVVNYRSFSSRNIEMNLLKKNRLLTLHVNLPQSFVHEVYLSWPLSSKCASKNVFAILCKVKFQMESEQPICL